MAPPDLSALPGILESRPPEPGELLPLLTLIQGRWRCLPEEALKAVSAKLRVPLARVFAVASFYKALSFTPKGERLVQVCCGTACHLKGSQAVAGAMEKSLGVAMGGTREDGKVTLEPVNCVGACALAPVVMLDGAVFGKVNPAAAAKLPLGA
ncbi:MAG: NAD(P)H-dependent oxidoreductase subunit E [Deltaproteobacteria bacterium]|jgi:NADH-quinone oxidoreductase subunit E|nr:NAD(P)H-dependent oxidoreductase subunit E [Deltaproteobacteria bacterium]